MTILPNLICNTTPSSARANLKPRLLNPIRLPFDDNINALLTRAA